MEIELPLSDTETNAPSTKKDSVIIVDNMVTIEENVQTVIIKF